jgi:hypothetical protein
MSAMNIVYWILCAASLAALSTVVWVSMKPIPFNLANSISGDWEGALVGCGSLLRSSPAFEVNVDMRAWTQHDEVFEQLSLPSQAPRVQLGNVSLDLTTSFLRRASGAAYWTWQGSCEYMSQPSTCSVILRVEEMIVTVAEMCSWHFVRNNGRPTTGAERKVKFSVVIIVMVLAIHGLLKRFRPETKRATKPWRGR